MAATNKESTHKNHIRTIARRKPIRLPIET
jgi:hypothetical protein